VARCAPSPVAFRWATLALVLGAGALACSPAGEGGGDVLRRLEHLAFVPAGECWITSSLPCGNPRPLVCDRYEVTRADWLAFVEREGLEQDDAVRALQRGWSDDDREHPACFVDLDDARAYAAEAGMRLPSAAEWLRIACGTRRQPWPWGYYRADSVANTLELGLGTSSAVGTFEQGRTPLGVYDLLGNVAEWVEGRLPEPRAEDGGARRDGLGWAMGGSYLTHRRPLYDLRGGELWLNHEELAERHRALGVGLRCVADAEEYLRGHAGQWGAGAGVRERLRAVGRAWGPAAVELLERLSAEEGLARDARLALTALLEGARG
jgi:hypothetical protein